MSNTGRERQARARLIRQNKEDCIDDPSFEVCSRTENKEYNLTLNSLIHVKPREGGSEVRVYDSRAVTAESLFRRLDRDPSNAGTFFETPSYFLWRQGDDDGEEEEIDDTEFIVATYLDGQTKILYPPAESLHSARNIEGFSTLQDTHPTTSAQERELRSGGSRQSTCDDPKTGEDSVSRVD